MPAAPRRRSATRSAASSRPSGSPSTTSSPALDAFLRALPSCLRPGGRVAVLTFHSGEDRRVKSAFKEGLQAGVYASIADEVVRASAEERRANPRSTSAKLRFAVRGAARYP